MLHSSLFFSKSFLLFLPFVNVLLAWMFHEYMFTQDTLPKDPFNPRVSRYKFKCADYLLGQLINFTWSCTLSSHRMLLISEHNKQKTTQ